MSVGLQRLREDAERIRKGARDKGEDPGLVDAAILLDVQRREARGRQDADVGFRQLDLDTRRPTALPKAIRSAAAPTPSTGRTIFSCRSQTSTCRIVWSSENFRNTSARACWTRRSASFSIRSTPAFT